MQPFPILLYIGLFEYLDSFLRQAAQFLAVAEQVSHKIAIFCCTEPLHLIQVLLAERIFNLEQDEHSILLLFWYITMRDFFPFMYEREKKEPVDNHIHLTIEEPQEQLPILPKKEENKENNIIIDILDQ